MSPASQVFVVLVGCCSVAAGDHFGDETKGLPPCKEQPGAVPASWVQKDLGASFSFALPACFAPAKEQERRYIHGGQRWHCDATTAEVVWGMWGRDSFGGDRQLCSMKVRGKRVMVARRSDGAGLSIVVWYPTKEIHEPIVSVWSPRAEDKALVSAIAFSGVVREK